MSFKSLSILWNLLTIGLVLIPIILLSRLQVIQELVCREPVCINYSSELRDSMNNKVRPCEDFYQHVCGRWIEEREKSNISTMIMIDQVASKIERQMHKVLNESWDNERNDINHNIIKSKSSSVKLALYMYHKCSTSAKNQSGSSADEEIYAFNRKWQNVLLKENVLDLLLEYYFQYGSIELIELELRETNFINQHPSIQLQLDHWSGNLYANINATTDSASDISGYVKLSDLNDRTGLNWVGFLNRLAEFSQASMHREFKDHDIVYVIDVITFTLVFDYIQEKLDKKLLHEHLYHQAMNFLIQVQQTIKNTDCFRKISHRSSPLYFAVARIWIDRFVKIGSQLKVMQITSEIKRATVEILKESQIFDTNTRNRLINKILTIVDDIAFPEWILSDEELDYFIGIDDRPIPDTIYECMIRLQQIRIRKVFHNFKQKPSRKYNYDRTYNPTVVNAHYDYKQNTIQILASLMFPPLFDVDLPFYVNFAGIGFMIGHEIFHSLGLYGIHKDWTGRKEQLNETFLKKFGNSTKCIQLQYSNVVDPLTNLPLNGRKTLEEDMADFNGLMASHRAFNNLLKDHGDSLMPIPILPDFTNYSINQVFFLAYSFQYCALRSRKYALYEMKQGVHSPNPYRVNEVLKNFEPFARAFGCPKGSKMISRNKCSIW